MFILIKLSFNLKDNLQHAEKSCIKRLQENGMRCRREAMPTEEVLHHLLPVQTASMGRTAEATSQKLWGEHVHRISVALSKRK